MKTASLAPQNHAQHLDDLHRFLETHGRLWREEVVDLYPHEFEIYPQEWLDYLDALSSETLWRVDARKIPAKEIACQTFRHFIQEMEALTDLPWAPVEDTGKLPSWAFFKVREKKRHEIMCLASFLKNLRSQNPQLFDRVVDIGGGVGHLARVLAFYFQFPFTSIDRDPVFHERGRKRLQKYPRPEGAKDVDFLTRELYPLNTHEVGQEVKAHVKGHNDEEMLKVFGPGHFSIGLHTCGGLSLSHFDLALKAGANQFLNFGCCYNKLDPDKQLFLSKETQKNPLTFTKYGLTLATRGHNEMTWKDYLLKERVKEFRYTLHLYLYHQHGVKEMISVGDERPRGYAREFGDYAKEKIENLGFERNANARQLNSFFEKKDIKRAVRTMYLCNVVRWQMGRTAEHYILRDRALFLEEKGYQTYLMNYFREDLSPRNIGLFATNEARSRE